MTLNRYARRRDANEATLVSALLAAGCDVEYADFCDLVVGRAGQTFLLEVKRHATARVTDRQKRLRSAWRGHYQIVSTVEQALHAVGLT